MTTRIDASLNIKVPLKFLEWTVFLNLEFFIYFATDSQIILILILSKIFHPL